MPEESTRGLLKLFGMAMTDFEDQTKAAVERWGVDDGPPPHPNGEALELVEVWLKANGEVMARWGETTQRLLETQAKGQAELLRVLAYWRQSGS